MELTRMLCGEFEFSLNAITPYASVTYARGFLIVAETRKRGFLIVAIQREKATARLGGPIVELRLASVIEAELWDFQNEMTAGRASLEFKVGQRIGLIAMVDDPDPLPPGSTGTITQIYDHGDWLQIDVDWDCGSTLMLSVPPDRASNLTGEV